MIRFTSDGSFIGKYQRLIKDVVIPFQHDILFDRADGVEKSHVAQNFINAARVLRGEDAGDGFYGMVFQDSDAYKWLEAAAYSLVSFPDDELEREMDEMVELIAAAQDADGYLNTYFTINDRSGRWTNLQEGHELYCSGHMIEAGVAYYEARGKRRLLDVCIRNVECIYRHFITEGHPGFPGHPEVELALMRLYHLTGNAHALELAKHFIDVRGMDPDFFKKECDARDWYVWGADPADPAYMQADMPVRDQSEAKGHAVRAVYLYTAMADLASVTGDSELKSAALRLWESITQRKMYITEGIGQTCLGEAFGPDYHLPNDTAYCETCASVGLMFLANRLLSADPDIRYSDVMERAFYNTVLSGIGLDGKSFFYVNPLETIPGVSGIAPTHRHALTIRFKWHACACCPPNAARLISSFGRYAYTQSSEAAFIHLYAGGTVEFDGGLTINCATTFPYGRDVTVCVQKGSGRIAIRIPGYAAEAVLKKNTAPADYTVKNGYAYVTVEAGDVITLSLGFEPVMNYASPKISGLAGHSCVSCGPLIYCFEGADNDDLSALLLRPDSAASAITEPAEHGILSNIPMLKMPAKRLVYNDALYDSRRPFVTHCTATAIPYYCRCNRGESPMKVWMPVISV